MHDYTNKRRSIWVTYNTDEWTKKQTNKRTHEEQRKERSIARKNA